MKILKYFLALFASILSFAVVSIFACGCGGVPGQTIEKAVVGAFNMSNVVFQGKVIDFEYRKGIRNEFMSNNLDAAGRPIGYKTMVVKFKVESWWKGSLASEVLLVTEQTRNDDGTSSSTSVKLIVI